MPPWRPVPALVSALARLPLQVAQMIRRARPAHLAHRQLERDTAAGLVAPKPPGLAKLPTNTAPGEGRTIATVTVPAVVGEDPEATMDVALYTLRRDGETLILNGSFTVNSEDGEQEERQLFHYLGNHGWAPHLIDSANLTRHDVLASAPTTAMTPSQSFRFRPGQTFYVYAAFAAPPADVESINVQLVDGAPMIVDVPIR